MPGGACYHAQSCHNSRTKVGNIPNENILPDKCPLDVNGDAVISEVLNKEIAIDEVQGCNGRIKK